MSSYKEIPFYEAFTSNMLRYSHPQRELIFVPTKKGKDDGDTVELITHTTEDGVVTQFAQDSEGLIVPPFPGKGYESTPKYQPGAIYDLEVVREFDGLMELDRKHNLSGNFSDSSSQ